MNYLLSYKSNFHFSMAWIIISVLHYTAGTGNIAQPLVAAVYMQLFLVGRELSHLKGKIRL